MPSRLITQDSQNARLAIVQPTRIRKWRKWGSSRKLVTPTFLGANHCSAKADDPGPTWSLPITSNTPRDWPIKMKRSNTKTRGGRWYFILGGMGRKNSPLVIKHGVLENRPCIKDFPSKTLYIVRGFSSQPCLMKPEGSTTSQWEIPRIFLSKKKPLQIFVVSPAAFVVADALPETQHGILQLVNSEPARPTNIVTQGTKT